MAQARRKTPGPSEHDEQKAVFEIAALHETKWPELQLLHAVPNGGHRHKATAVRLKAEGVRAGVPDIDLPVKRGKYTGLHIEMKVWPNKATPEQKAWLKALRGQGRYCTVCYGANEAWAIIMRYLTGDL